MLKKGDKVIIHSHRYAELYKGQTFTCGTDEEVYEGERIVFLKDLKEYGASFLVKFLKKVEV